MRSAAATDSRWLRRVCLLAWAAVVLGSPAGIYIPPYPAPWEKGPRTAQEQSKSKTNAELFSQLSKVAPLGKRYFNSTRKDVAKRKWRDVVVVMHCAAARGGMRAVLREHSKTWLKDVAVLFADHDEDSTIPGLVAFPERPTTEVGKTFLGFPKYRGADRSLWAVEFAVRHYDFEWLIFCDDDNYVDLSILYPFLGRLNATVPLFLTSRVGPGKSIQENCLSGDFDAQKHLNISCCHLMRGVETKACNHVLLEQPTNAVASNLDCENRDGGRCRGAKPVSKPVPCEPLPEFEHGCCPIEPAPSRLVNEGYPWQVALSYPMRGETPFFVPPMWAYGGAGYVLSKGLAENVIGAEGWRLCRERIVCHNADVRVTKCVHNFGHGVTLTPPNVAIAKAHHVHEAAQVTALWRAEQAHTTATKRSAAKFKHATQPHGTRGRRRAA